MNDRLLVRLGWVLPAITIPLAMLIHVVSGNARAFPIFISESDYPGLERLVFTIGLAVTGGILVAIAWRLWERLRGQAKPWLLTVGGLAGALTGSSLSIMAFNDMYDHIDMHVITALGVFWGGTAWALCFHLSLPNLNEKGKRLRKWALVLVFTSIISMTLLMKLAFDAVPDAREPLDLNAVQEYVAWAALAEYALFIALIMCLISFERDLIDSTNHFSEE